MEIDIIKTTQPYYIFNYNDINCFDYDTINLINSFGFYVKKNEFRVSKAYYEEFLNKIKNKYNIIFKGETQYQPIIRRDSGYILKDFQINGVKFLIENNLALLCDDVGMGKTIQAIFGLKNIQKQDSKFLIISPKSLIKQWETKIKEFHLDNITRVVNYEHLVTNYDKFNDLFDCIIVDEASRLRNKTLYRKALKKLKSVRYWLLSAMLIEKNPYDLYNIITTFQPNYFKYNLFDSQFAIRKIIYDKTGQQREVISGWRNLDLLHKQIKPIYLSRTRSDIEMIESKLKIDDNRIKLPENIRANILPLLDFTDDNILANFQRIRLYLDGVNERGELINSFKILKLRNVRGKTIVFTAYKMVAEKIYQYLYAEALLLTGDNSIKDREEAIERFKNSKNVRFLITTDILKYGMNIPEADVIIHYDLPLTYATLIQREGRNNRIDSPKEERRIIYLLTDHYFDNHIYNIVMKKKDINERVMMNEIKEMLKNRDNSRELATEP